MQQQTIFHLEKQINNFHAAPRTESKTSSATVKLTPTQKEALARFSGETGIGMSTVISDALDIYFALFPHGNKVHAHKEVLHSLLDTW